MTLSWLPREGSHSLTLNIDNKYNKCRVIFLKVKYLSTQRTVQILQEIQKVYARMLIFTVSLSCTGVKSDFDFCQSSIKKIFNDNSLAKRLKENHGIQLSAANSINWGRLLPQVVYHCSSYLDLVEKGIISIGDPVDLCIPTGNFGNILAAYYAKVTFVHPKPDYEPSKPMLYMEIEAVILSV